MADEIKLKAPTVEQQVVVNINGEDKLKSFADTLDKISNNKNLQRYWKTQQELINATADAYSNFQKKASKDNASELIKVTNALKAMSGTDLSHILPDFDKISKSIAEAQMVAENIDSAFSVKGFKEAFDSFETLKAYGTDIQKLFSHFGVSSDIGELQQNVRLLEGEVEKLTRRLNNARNANEELRNEFENFKIGSGFADKLDELDRLKAEMQNIRNEATQTFNQFLDANKIDRYDWFNDDRFTEYFEKLENGTLTATEAIRRFKSEYFYLLEDSYKSSGDSFGLDQLQAFSVKLDIIFHQVEETSNKINDILSEISVSAKGFTDTFKNGLNVNASVEEIEKLTNRVKELESELAKIKTPISSTPQVETNISSEISAVQQQEKIQNKVTQSIQEQNKAIDESIKKTLTLNDVRQKQWEIIQKTNPKEEGTNSTWVDKPEDAKTFYEVNHKDSDYPFNENYSDDWTVKDKMNVEATGKITVYSSYPIEDGNWVTPSKEEGLSYAGSGKLYSATIDPRDIAWVDAGQGQVAHISDELKEVIDLSTKAETQVQNIDNKTNETGSQSTLNTLDDTIAKYETIVALVKEYYDLSNNKKDTIGMSSDDERISEIRKQLKSYTQNPDYNGEYKMGFGGSGKNIFAKSVDLSQEEMLQEICNMLGVEIPKNADKAKEAIKEVASATTSTEQKKDAFPETSDVASVEKVADGFKEVKQETEKATESAKEYSKILSQVGEYGVDRKVSAVYKRNDGQLESVNWRAKTDDNGQILYDKDGNIDYDFNMTVISKYEQLEKIIVKADDELRNLQKDLAETKNYNPTASTDNIEEKIADQKAYIQLLEQTVKVISQSDEYLMMEQQIIDARNKAAREYALTMGAKQEKSDAKKTASDEEKRLNNITQINRALNKQQILIDEIEKTYSKTANPDLDRVVSSQSDLTELANKKAEIQTLLNKLNNQGRNASNEQEFLQLEKLISEYKQLAKDKLKANNPSKQELGGQQLDVLLSQQVAQYNQLIAKAEKYGDATSDIVQKLKDQRDTIAEINSDGIYTAKSGLKADDYYSARDNYKKSKAEFTSYETYIKSASNVAKQEASNIQAEWDKNIKAIQDYMDAVTKLNNLKAKDKGTGSEANQIALQTQNVEELKQAAWDARQNLSSMQAENPDIIAWKQWVDMMELFDQASKGSAESAAKLKDVLDNIKAPSLDKYENKLSSYLNKTGGYNATIARFKDGGWASDTYVQNVKAVEVAVAKYETLLKEIKAKGGIASEEDVQKLKEYEGEIKKTISTVSNMSASEKGYNFVSGQKELDKIHKLLAENSKMSSDAKAKIRAYYAEIESGNPSMSLDKIHGEIMKIYNAEVEAGRAGRSFFDTLKNSGFHQLAAQMAGMFGFYDVINGLKQVASTVIDLNTQITDLAKVSEATSSQIYDDFNSYADIAKDIGGTISDTISATANWSRNGYNLPDSKELARVALLYKNVGDGIDIDTANESLISTLRGFKMEADEAEKIIDIFNNVSNNEPIDSGGIGEALQRSAASFNAANTSLQESVALISTTNSVIQNPEKVGNMWKVVSMRIRSATSELEQAGEDTDGLVTSTADLQKMIKAMTGYDILESDGKTFKSIYDIVLNISKVWNNLSDLDQSSLLQALAGKQQSNALAAALSNPELLEKSYQEAMDSAGSAAEEEKKYQQSVQYSIDQTKAKLEELSADLLSSDFLKGAIDAGGKLIEVLDGIVKSGNAIPTLLTAIGAGLSFKNIGKCYVSA